MTSAIFCTAAVDLNPARYQAWIDFYTERLAGEGIDLHLYNDGPCASALELRGATLHTDWPRALGRVTNWRFPGWKRSFYTAVPELAASYDFVGHIESDLGLTRRGLSKFLTHLRTPGLYATGYSARYGFCETALQVINSRTARMWYEARRCEGMGAFVSDEPYEPMIDSHLQPKYFHAMPNLPITGDRWEGDEGQLARKWDYLAQCPLDVFRTLEK